MYFTRPENPTFSLWERGSVQAKNGARFALTQIRAPRPALNYVTEGSKPRIIG